MSESMIECECVCVCASQFSARGESVKWTFEVLQTFLVLIHHPIHWRIQLQHTHTQCILLSQVKLRRAKFLESHREMSSVTSQAKWFNCLLCVCVYICVWGWDKLLLVCKHTEKKAPFISTSINKAVEWSLVAFLSHLDLIHGHLAVFGPLIQVLYTERMNRLRKTLLITTDDTCFDSFQTFSLYHWQWSEIVLCKACITLT